MYCMWEPKVYFLCTLLDLVHIILIINYKYCYFQKNKIGLKVDQSYVDSTI